MKVLRHFCLWTRAPLGTIGVLASVIAISDWVGLAVPMKTQAGLFLVICTGVLAFVYDGLFVSRFLRNCAKLHLSPGHVLRIEYGDIFDQEGLIVVPVNDCFDTEVGEGQISARSIHGQLISKLSREDVLALDQEIAAQLRGAASVWIERPKGGKNLAYALGTVAPVDLPVRGSRKRCLFVASTVTRIEDNSVVSDAKCIRRTVWGILDFVHRCGAGRTVVLPLIGSGHAQTGMPLMYVLNLMVMVMVEYVRKYALNSDMTIVLYSKYRNAFDLGLFQDFWESK